MKRFFTRLLIKIANNRYIKFTPQKEQEVLFVLGMFRSGTTLVSRILIALGIDAGPKFRLLKARGKLSNLNPDGFFEDYLFIQLSFYWANQLAKTGDDLPTLTEVSKLNLHSIKIGEFIRFSEFSNKENRLNYLSRHILYVGLILKREKLFLDRKNYFVKNPMLTPFYNQIVHWYPNAKFLIVIRNPSSTINSSLQLTDKSNIFLYNSYYNHLYELLRTFPKRTTIFSYDELILNPEYSIHAISQVYNLKYDETIKNLIKLNLLRYGSNENIISDYYNTLYEKSINLNK